MHVVSEIEQLKTNAKSRPLADVIINGCGELVRSKKKRRVSESESDGSESDARYGIGK